MAAEKPTEKRLRQYTMEVMAMDAFNGRPGFYSQAYYARCLFKNYMDNIDIIPEEVLVDVSTKWLTVTGFIAGADGLSKAERDLAIRAGHQWSGGKATTEQMMKALDAGMLMTPKQAIDYAQEVVRTTGGDITDGREQMPMLYDSLTISRSDGLSEQEKNSFSGIAKALGCTDDLVNELIETYLLEVKFAKALERLMKGDEARRFTIEGVKDEWRESTKKKGLSTSILNSK